MSPKAGPVGAARTAAATEARAVPASPAGERAVIPHAIVRSQAAATGEAARRVRDFVLASLLLVLTAPVLLVAAAAVRLDSSGPAAIWQRRVGRHGRVFEMLKLRTMVDGTHGFVEKQPDDGRVTRVGRILRTTSIDELPQLWNIIRGDMSLVGPRPLPLDEHIVRGCPGGARLTVRPGLTGPWQVRGRSEIPFEQRLLLDEHYVCNRTLGWDLILLAQTVPAVLSRRGAY